MKNNPFPKLPAIYQLFLFFAAICAWLWLQAYVVVGRSNLMNGLSLVALVTTYVLGRRTSGVWRWRLLNALGGVGAALLVGQFFVFGARPPFDPNGLASLLLLAWPLFPLATSIILFSLSRGALVAGALTQTK